MTEPQVPRTGDAVYYQHAGKLPFVTRISQRARLDVYQAFIDACRPGPDTTVLDVGVSLEVSSPESNTLEQHYPYRNRLACAGIGDGAAVQAAYPGVTFVRIEPHQPLPFRDGEFAIAYCNAVVEHAGTRAQQAALVAELCRVATEVFLVVPNRLFPVEQHTGLPLVHYLPLRLFRALLRRTPWRFWADEDHLNPLTPGDLAALIPPGWRMDLAYRGLGPRPIASNLAARISRA